MMTFTVDSSPGLVFSKAGDGYIEDDTPGQDSFSPFTVPPRVGERQTTKESNPNDLGLLLGILL